MREDLIERVRERAEFEDKRVLDEAKALGFVPEVYSGSQTGALLREAAAALEAAREDAIALASVRTHLPTRVETDTLGDYTPEECAAFDAGYNAALDRAHNLLNRRPGAIATIDQARGKGGGEVG